MTVRHSGGSYGVRTTTLAEALADLPADCRILTDANVASLAPLPEGIPALVLPPGEGTKSLDAFGEALGWLARTGASRRTTVVALGGGVVGDLGGFVAAAYMRGVPLLQIPTTLLAMVDSSVGGKVAIDLPEGKNLAGAFWPPVEVRIPLDALDTLDARQRRNGLAEVLKYGFIMDPPILDLPVDVMRCVALKAQVVEEDEHGDDRSPSDPELRAYDRSRHRATDRLRTRPPRRSDRRRHGPRGGSGRTPRNERARNRNDRARNPDAKRPPDRA